MLVSVMFGSITCVQAMARSAEAMVHNTDGQIVGTLILVQDSDGVTITMEGRNLPPGFHGFHIHETGKCEAPFTSAGGHFNPEKVDHPHHAGDLPNLLVNSDGGAFMMVKTDRFKLRELLEGDGAALIIHSDPDNHANIPNRYSPEADKSTLATGDAGTRIACGVIIKR
jgi:Cu-Zn family superoxide dismutase